MCLESLKQSGLHEIDGLLKYRVYATIRYESLSTGNCEKFKEFCGIIEINRCIISNYGVNKQFVLSEKEFPTILFLSAFLCLRPSG